MGILWPRNNLSSRLIKKCSFYCVLLGQIQSDSLEERFGWFWQMHGGYYYISVRQVLESERKIRAIYLTKFSGYLPQEIAIDASETIQSDIKTEALKTFHSRPTADYQDLNAAFNVAGALCKSELRLRNCVSCASMLSEDRNLVDLHSSFLEKLDRSCLTSQTTLLSMWW